jgi:DNA-directed RNA polymerase specialized sigma54-like protein
MELPIIDLRDKIQEEIERNPALEILSEPGVVSLDAAYAPPKEEDDYFEATSDAGFVKRNGDEASDEQRKFIEGVLSRSETLQEHLLLQLQLEPADIEIRAAGELLIQNLNADGFHREPPNLLLKDTPQAIIQKAMRLVQALDPAGTCTADYKESLSVQIALLPDAPEGMTAALDCLELLERGKFSAAAKQLGRTVPETEEIFRRIKELSPFPGRRFGSGDTRYVVPDVQVLKKEGGFVIRLNNDEIPVLGIHPFFMEISENFSEKENSSSKSKNFSEKENFSSEKENSSKSENSSEKENSSSKSENFSEKENSSKSENFSEKENFSSKSENSFSKENFSSKKEENSGKNLKKEEKKIRDFARENVKEARWFIHSINQRNHTLLKVSRAILTFQREFFLKGPKYLAPLTLRDIADELGVHETTISRAANGKYMQTEWGIFEIRYFFTNSISGAGSSGSRYSKEGVKEILRELITGEERRYSDQELVGLLAKQGISLARRTVAKYRNELDLGSSYTRKETPSPQT